MITLEPTLFYFMLEVIGILAVGCGLLVAAAWHRVRRRKVVMIDLVHRLKSAGAQRVASLEAQIKQKHGMSDENAHEITTHIVTAETHFYQFLVKALLEVDNRQLLELDHEVEHLTDAISKAMPLMANATAAVTPAASAQAESAQVTQLLGTIEKNHAQLLGEIKKSAESMRNGLSTIASVTPVAVAAAGAAMSEEVAAAPSAPDTSGELEALPDIEDAIQESSQDSLESLPDIDDSVDISAPPASTAPVESDIVAVSTETKVIDQIAEMPDDLLAGMAEFATTPATSTPIAAVKATTELELTLTDLDTAPTEATPISAATPVATPLSQPVTPAKSTPAPAATPASSTAMSSDDIDALLNGTTPTPSKPAAAASTPQAAAPPPENTASLDEIYSSAPLIPETDGKTEIVPQPADNTNRADTVDSAAPAVNNVDDLLAELDALLK